MAEVYGEYYYMSVHITEDEDEDQDVEKVFSPSLYSIFIISTESISTQCTGFLSGYIVIFIPNTKFN